MFSVEDMSFFVTFKTFNMHKYKAEGREAIVDTIAELSRIGGR